MKAGQERPAFITRRHFLTPFASVAATSPSASTQGDYECGKER